MKRKTKGYIVIALIVIFVITSFSSILSYRNNENIQQNTYFSYAGKNITPNEYKVYYGLCVNEFIDKYGIYLEELNLDLNKDFSKQMYDEERSWEDMFIDQTEAYIKQYIILNNDAADKNITFDVQKYTDTLVDIFKQNAQYTNVTFEEYLSNLFGPGVVESDVRKALTYKYASEEYSKQLMKNFEEEITDKDLISAYTDFSASFDTITFRKIVFNNENKNKETLEAEAIAFHGEVKTEEEFIEKAKEFTEEDTLFTDTGASEDLSEEEIAWLYDESRKKGDIEILNSGENLEVVMFLKRELLEQDTKNFRHIFVATYGLSEAEKEMASSETRAVLSMFEDSEKTEEDFSLCALIYSDDSVTSQNGGLVTNVRKNDLDGKLNDWLFDNSRKYGDYEIIEGPTGYHIMYYIGDGGIYWKNIAKTFLATERYNTYTQALISVHEMEENAEVENKE